MQHSSNKQITVCVLAKNVFTHPLVVNLEDLLGLASLGLDDARARAARVDSLFGQKHRMAYHRAGTAAQQQQTAAAVAAAAAEGTAAVMEAAEQQRQQQAAARATKATRAAAAAATAADVRLKDDRGAACVRLSASCLLPLRARTNPPAWPHRCRLQHRHWCWQERQQQRHTRGSTS